MTRVVIDTNVIVSAIITPGGPPSQLMTLVLSNKLQACYCSKIMEEYRDVLFRPKFGFNPRTVMQMLDRIGSSGISINPAPSTIALPDEKDRIFYDVAAATGAYLITGNIKHYPTEPFIMLTADFLGMFRH
jgi:putative PIN family toxin of toxin-antitoxin system